MVTNSIKTLKMVHIKKTFKKKKLMMRGMRTEEWEHTETRNSSQAELVTI